MPQSQTQPGPLIPVFAAQAGTSIEELPCAIGELLVQPEHALPIASSTDRVAWGAVDAAALVERAEIERGTAWPQPLAHDAARAHGDGDRNTWEQTAFARVQRSSRSIVAAVVTGDEKWFPEVLDGIVLLCEQSSWCWPAHDEAAERNGWVLPDITAPVIDLGAGEIAAHLAWFDHVLGAELEAMYPGVRARVRQEVRARVIDPFVTRDDWWWLGRERKTINWTPWILGNVLVAGLRLLDAPEDAESRARVVSIAVEGLDRYVADLPEDGAVDEGYHYWWAGAARLLEALDLITHATAGALDPFTTIPKLRETVAFPHRMQLGDDWFVSVADAQARSLTAQPWHVLARAARRVGDKDAWAFARLNRSPVDASEAMGLGRLLLELVDGCDANVSHAPLPAEVWLPSTQMLVERETEGSTHGLTVVAKAGDNDESHNHNDVGTVIVASDGVPVVVDAGRPTYTAQTFGPDRYELWMMQSSWHSVPLIGGRAQRDGAEFAATAVSVGDGALSLELAAAYGLVDSVSWKRTITLDRSAHEVVVHDAWEWLEDSLPEGPSEVRFLLAGDVTLSAGAARIVPLDGAPPLVLSWNAQATAALVARPLDDPMLTNVWGEKLTRLDIDVSRLSELTVAVRQDDSKGER